MNPNHTTSMLKLKESLVKNGLSESIGLAIRGKDCVVIMLKARHMVSFHELPEKGSHIFVWAIGGSELDVRNYKHQYLRLTSRFSNTFSRRDLNFSLIHDFTASYLRQGLYNIKSAEPTSLELIIGYVGERSMVFYTLNYAGKAEAFDEVAGNIIAIGSHSTRRSELLKSLHQLGTSNLDGKEIVKKVTPHLKPFYGEEGTIVFTITSQKTVQHKKPTKKNKTRRK